MSLIFVYPFIEDGEIFRPKVPIIITNPNEKVSTRQWGILDTGADSCVFNRFVAKQTHHNLKGDGVETEITFGVGEEFVTIWKHTFVIELLSPDQQSVVWKSPPSLIGCIDHDGISPILGFEHFLSFFNISFKYQEKQILIEIM